MARAVPEISRRKTAPCRTGGWTRIRADRRFSFAGLERDVARCAELLEIQVIEIVLGGDFSASRFAMFGLYGQQGAVLAPRVVDGGLFLHAVLIKSLAGHDGDAHGYQIVFPHPELTLDAQVLHLILILLLDQRDRFRPVELPIAENLHALAVQPVGAFGRELIALQIPAREQQQSL